MGGRRMKCPNCGAKNDKGASFCGNCGKSLELKQVPKSTDIAKKSRKSLIYLVLAIAIVGISVSAGIFMAKQSKMQEVNKTADTKVTKQSKKKTHQTKEKITFLTSTKIADYSPKEAVAIIVAYMKNQENPVWSKLTQQDEIDLKIRQKANYQFAVSDPVYVFNESAAYSYVPDKQDANDMTVVLYTNAGKTVSYKNFSSMVRTLRRQKLDQETSELSKIVKVIDQRNQTSAAKTSYPGDKGLYTFPEEMRGKWYYWDKYDKKVKMQEFTEHNIVSEMGSSEAHEMDPHFLATFDYSKISKEYREAAKDWVRIMEFDKPLDGIYWINVRGYFQGAGDGEYYALHTEKGQPVLLVAVGAQVSVTDVAFRSPDLAKKYKDYQFSDLRYLD
ncbi:hypothetical protein FC52_GL001034 [Lactobacillus pasteurii DSM 23907 = CRBIP 24.76]|nr:hypothetical protein FC52_GL001034 [Lactobacillus pasteurii DSM 23907 = CRBIP 24.76]